MKFQGHLVSIKNVFRGCTTTCKPDNIKSPYRDLGTFKTDVMILCNDNIRRRVWCNSDINSYKLFVNVGGEHLILAKNQNDLISFGIIEDLINL